MTRWWFSGSQAKYIYNHHFAKQSIKSFIMKYITDGDEIQTGGEPTGIDEWTEQIIIHDSSIKLYLPNIRLLPSRMAEWNKYGKSAGIIRNHGGVDWSEEVAVFWDGASRGTQSVVDYSKKTGKPIHINKLFA